MLEAAIGKAVTEALEELFTKLGMKRTFVYGAGRGHDFAPIRYRENVLHIPQFLASTGNEIVSTAEDQMTFVRAFFEGQLFGKEKLESLMQWRRVFFPFEYGIGIQRLRVPGALSWLQPIPEMIGQVGSVGSVAFYIPERECYITGTVNQQASPQTAIQTVIRILREWR